MKINNFRGDLTDVSAKKEALQVTPEITCLYWKKKVFAECKYPKYILFNFENKITSRLHAGDVM